jgi:hypothetical protein
MYSPRPYLSIYLTELYPWQFYLSFILNLNKKLVITGQLENAMNGSDPHIAYITHQKICWKC